MSIPLPAANPGLTPLPFAEPVAPNLPGPMLRVSPFPTRPFDAAAVTGGRRVDVRIADAVDVELPVPLLVVLIFLFVEIPNDDAGLGAASVDEGFREVVGTNPDDGFRWD